MKKIISAFLFIILFSAPVFAFPMSGIYFQAHNIYEVNVYNGMIQAYLIPAETVTKQNLFDFFDLSVKFPVPVLKRTNEIPLDITVDVGYHQQSNWAKDVIRGADIGASASYYPLDWLGLHVRYTGTNLLQGHMGENYLPLIYMYMPRVETGITFDLPHDVVLGVGYQIWSYPSSFYYMNTDWDYNIEYSGGFQAGVNWRFNPFGEK